MKTIGIVCEYNPFHNGHKFHIENAKKLLLADKVVCVMSGSFVQRGEIAVYDKWTRAKMAILNGADLVLEIPSYFCMQSSKEYAYGAVSVLNLLGNVDYLSFGSEEGNLEVLEKIAKIKRSKEYNLYLKEFIESGLSYSLSSENALKKILDYDDKKRIFSPNNLLGIEYIEALNKTKSKIKAHTIKRHLTDHLENEIENNFATASKIREFIKEGKDFKKYVPYDDIFDTFDEQNAESFILGFFRLLSDKKSILGGEDGLCERLIKCAKESASLDEFYNLSTSKRYTKSRIKRCVKCAILDVKKASKLDYIRVLAFNDKGREILKASQNKDLIVTKTADFNPSKNSMFKYDIMATDFMYLCANDNKKRKSGMDFTTPPVYIKN
ncbi:MAG: nucleotidyltransferase family protein [Ruminococcaceae bacterium]|nr:nucleotidyltransferase family protein [Oscillospiraceae bacterium]